MARNSAGDDLMALIDSLSKSEKRYFKLHASKGLQQGMSVYLQLYDHLVAQGEWSEAAIRTAFAGQPFLTQLVVARTRLQDMILEALRDFDARHAHRLDFSQRYDAIDVTYRRKLYGLCRRLVDAALRHAAALDLPMETLRLLEWAMRLERQQRASDITARLDHLHARYAHASAQLHTEAQMRVAYDAMARHLPQRAAQGVDGRQAADAILQNAVMQIPEAALTFDAKIMRCYIQSYHALVCGDVAGNRAYLEQIVAIWKSSPTRMRDQEETYFEAMAACADSAFATQGAAQQAPIVAKSKRMIDRSSRIQKQSKDRVLSLKLEQCISGNEWDAAAKLLPQVKSLLLKSASNIAKTVRLMLIGNATTVQFYLEQWAEVLTWANWLESEAAIEAGTQWQDLVRLWRWTAWYALGDHDQLERSLDQQLLKQPADPLSPHFKALLQATSPRQESQAFAALQATLQTKSAQDKPFHWQIAEVWVIAQQRGIAIREAEIFRDVAI